MSVLMFATLKRLPLSRSWNCPCRTCVGPTVLRSAWSSSGGNHSPQSDLSFTTRWQNIHQVSESRCWVHIQIHRGSWAVLGWQRFRAGFDLLDNSDTCYFCSRCQEESNDTQLLSSHRLLSCFDRSSSVKQGQFSWNHVTGMNRTAHSERRQYLTTESKMFSQKWYTHKKTVRCQNIVF